MTSRSFFFCTCLTLPRSEWSGGQACPRVSETRQWVVSSSSTLSFTFSSARSTLLRLWVGEIFSRTTRLCGRLDSFIPVSSVPIWCVSFCNSIKGNKGVTNRAGCHNRNGRHSLRCALSSKQRASNGEPKFKESSFQNCFFVSSNASSHLAVLPVVALLTRATVE